MSPMGDMKSTGNMDNLRAGVARDRGIPHKIASDAARLKLRTDVIDMTILHRYRLKALRIR
jgi:hypothetical protein